MNIRAIFAAASILLFLSIPFLAWADTYGGCTYGLGLYDDTCDSGGGSGGSGGSGGGSGGSGGGGPVFGSTASILGVLPTTTKSIVSSTKPVVSNATSTVAITFVFTHNLAFGMTDPDVKVLQQFLNANGFTITKSGAGSLGKESDYFGGLTQIALGKFQKANGISPSVGYFGTLTRALVNKLTGAPSASSTPPQSIQSAQPSAQIGLRTLSLGMSGQDVSDLQTFLASQPGLYPSGEVSGYFGMLTQQAVGDFQFKYGIIHSAADSGYGTVGPRTRSQIAKIEDGR